MDSLRYLREHCNDVVVVVPPGESPIRTAVHTYASGVTTLQCEPKGVVHAIGGPAEDILVAFSDCYGYRNIGLPAPNTATTVLGAVDGLDGWADGVWIDRIAPREKSFIGAFRCSNWQPTSNCLMECFNSNGIKTHDIIGMVDCGTPEGYERIWKCGL